MTLKTFQRAPQYEIGRFPDQRYTSSSPHDVRLEDAVKFASKQGGILQSMPEATAFRLESNNEDHSGDSQITRTTALYLCKNGKVYVGFDHNAEQNMVLNHAAAIQVQECKGLAQKQYTLSKTDKSIEGTLQRMTLLEIPKRCLQEGELKLSLSMNGEFSTNSFVRELLGETATEYEEYLGQQQYKHGVINFPDVYRHEDVMLGHEVIIAPCALGGDVHEINSLWAYCPEGVARGVIYKK